MSTFNFTKPYNLGCDKMKENTSSTSAKCHSSVCLPEKDLCDCLNCELVVFLLGHYFYLKEKFTSYDYSDVGISRHFLKQSSLKLQRK